MLHPGEFVLGSTFESVSLPDDLAGRLEGKSSPWTRRFPRRRVGGRWATLRVGRAGVRNGRHTHPRRRRHRGHARPAVLRGVLLRRAVAGGRRRAPVADDDRARRAGAGSRARSLPTTGLAGSPAGRVPRGTTTSPSPGPCSTPEQDLPVDPYVLGARLAAVSDGDEHVPAPYLTGSVAQRRALLQRADGPAATSRPSPLHRRAARGRGRGARRGSRQAPDRA